MPNLGPNIENNGVKHVMVVQSLLDELIETGSESEIRRSELVGIVAEEKGNLISMIDLSIDNGQDALFYDDPDVIEESELVPLIKGFDTIITFFLIYGLII